MPRLLLIILSGTVLIGIAMIPVARRRMHVESGMTAKHSLRKSLAVIAAMFGGGTRVGAAPPVPPTTLGVTLTAPNYYSRARAFANMASGAYWGASDHHALTPEEVDEDGNIKTLASGVTLTRLLTPPNFGPKTVKIRCSWQGKAILKPKGRRVSDVRYTANAFTFTFNNEILGNEQSIIMLQLSYVDSANPLRSLDCREASLPAAARFDPLFLESLRDFKVLRFMDWQRTNTNSPVSWATRHRPSTIERVEKDGVPIEDMIDLAKETGTDPWFNMPWNADDDYYLRFARMVHDSLPASRTVYVELGNELWNHAFPASKQSQKEGQEANLADDPNRAGLRRYAQKLAHVMDIWAKVYSDRPGKLVRVAACQNGDICAKEVLGYADTANHVDALATAPYFGNRLNKTAFASVDDLFAVLDAEIERTLGLALQAKAVAVQHGKRYIAYEGGQHFIFKDLAFEQQVEHDPRMYDAYKKYLNFWKTRIGDTFALYSFAGPMTRWGAWGLVDYIGQPLENSPKMRAVHDFSTETGNRK